MNSFAAVRPYRKTAIRVERQIMDGKIIFHNYGHGASGISVSPATAF